MDTRFSTALHALIMIADSRTPLTSDDIARSVGTNPSYIRKILGLLKKQGIIESRQGVNGFSLRQKAENITLLQVYQAVNESEIVRLFDMHRNSSDQCIVGRNIEPVLEGVFSDVSQAFSRSLAKKTLFTCVSSMKDRIKAHGMTRALMHTGPFNDTNTQKGGKDMSKICIMTDSASDISFEDEKKHSISVIPFPITLGDKTYISRVDFDNDKFYELMAQYDGIPTTAQITPFEFQEIYLKEAESGTTDLIMVLINSKGSSTYDNSVMAIDMFYDEHPEYRESFHIYSIDGMGYNALYGSPVVHAAEMRDKGASAKEIVDYLTEILPKRQIYFGIYELKYAARSGRIPTAAAFVGTTLNLKPVMKIFDRAITTAAKCRGENKLVERVVEMSVLDMEPGSPYELIYGNDTTCLERLRAAMVERLGYEPSAAYQIGAAVAANAGPKVAGVAFTAKKD